MNDSAAERETSVCMKPSADQAILNTRILKTFKLVKLTSNAAIFTLQGISTKILLLLMNESVFVCLLLNEPDVTV